MTDLFDLVDLLAERHALTHEEYRALVEGQTPELAAYAAKKADALRREIYGTDVYVRGLIEIGNYCKNDCIYCGIRKSNADHGMLRGRLELRLSHLCTAGRGRHCADSGSLLAGPGDQVALPGLRRYPVAG